MSAPWSVIYTLQYSLHSMERLISLAACISVAFVLPLYGSVLIVYVGVCMGAHVLSWIYDNNTTYTRTRVSWHPKGVFILCC